MLFGRGVWFGVSGGQPWLVLCGLVCLLWLGPLCVGVGDCVVAGRTGFGCCTSGSP